MPLTLSLVATVALGTMLIAPALARPSTAAVAVLLGAGDIASCSSSGDTRTAALLGANAGTIVTLGDNAYELGTPSQFTDCFGPTWGTYRARIRPAPGNHDYGTAGAGGYFGYFGAAAGEPSKGYYAFDLGEWRVYSLNSNCSQVGGCTWRSPQGIWLRADLAANPRQCVLAYWHHPRFSSGAHGSSITARPLWRMLYNANAEVVLAGHDHSYERFAPQDQAGTLDRARGIRQFVVGTGGRSHYAFPGPPIANSRAHNADTYGVLKMTLGSGGYSWQFLPESGKDYSDSGSAACH